MQSHHKPSQYFTHDNIMATVLATPSCRISARSSPCPFLLHQIYRKASVTQRTELNRNVSQTAKLLTQKGAKCSTFPTTRIHKVQLQIERPICFGQTNSNALDLRTPMDEQALGARVDCTPFALQKLLSEPMSELNEEQWQARAAQNKAAVEDIGSGCRVRGGLLRC